MSSSFHPSDSRSSASSSEAEVLVKVEGVSKKFCRDLKKSLWYGVKDVAAELLPFHASKSLNQNSPETLRPGEFWANKDISFELRRGECLGLIGHNGAGKTTLLKMLNGLIKPDSGRIEMRGRVGALIALGAGFNPILTGRENVYVNGAILGLSKTEVDERMDEIIDFAEIRDFIDSPVHSYSSGMQVRLGFAVATALKPDVLILDEVLAVGDISFRSKCYQKIGELKEHAAVIFVSHNINQISSICTSCLVLSKGRSSGVSPVDRAIQEYQDRSGHPNGKNPEAFCRIENPVIDGQVLPQAMEITVGADFRINTRLILSQPQPNAQIRVILYTKENLPLVDWWSLRNGQKIDLAAGTNEISIVTGPIHLRADCYLLSFMVFDSSGIRTIFWSYLEHQVTFVGSSLGSPVQMPKGSLCIQKL